MAVANAEERIPFRDSGPGKIYSSRLKSEIRPILPEADTLSKNFLLRVSELGDESRSARSALASGKSTPGMKSTAMLSTSAWG